MSVVAASVLLSTATARAQQPAAAPPAQVEPGGATICGQQVPPPRALPPAGSGPVVYLIAPCFEAQGNVSLVDYSTYLYYIQTKASQPSQNIWVPYNDDTETSIRDDFKRLWGTNFLDNLSIDVEDYTFANGVIGKLITYDMEERQRVKIVDFVGSKKLETSKIDEKLKENNAQIRLDTFIDPALIRKIEGIIRDMMKEKGFQSAEITHDIKAIEGGPKLVHVTFNMSEGPKVKIRRVEFTGNTAMSDGRLRRKMKENRAHWFLSFITGRGVYQETKFEEDAERVMEYYRDRGYIRAQVGEPEIRPLGDSDDKKTRWVELRIPVQEGNRYKVNSFDVAGNTVVKSDALKPLFKLQQGQYYNQKQVRKGFQKAQEIYGAGGYMEFTGYPDYKFSDEPNPAEPQAPKSLAAVDTKPAGPPTVDVTLQIQEGKQYFVNRIIFTGNTTTRDNVIRRELRLYENGVFNTEALKYSIKRLNQLGYFKALEGPGKDVNVDKLTSAENKVDVKMKLEEQNRNQLTFGAGVSQFEGFFGQLSFQTANFLGRGESLTVSLQGGQRAQNYTLSFTEPFLFDRNITGGANLFRSDVRYVSQFTQQSTGGTLTFGFPVGNGFTRAFTNYSYERVRVTEINTAFTDPLVLARNPYLRDSLLIGAGGERIISKVVPSLIYNSVDQPIFPTTGRRLSLSADVAGLGGNTKFLKPTVEAVAFLKQNNRMTLGVRGQVEYVRAYGGTSELPIFEKLFMGGEYTIRGFDLRTIGPSDLSTGLVLGGNKSLLFNVEQIFSIAGPVRLILFYDAGQIRDTGQSFAWKEDIQKIETAAIPLLYDPLQSVTLSPCTIQPDGTCTVAPLKIYTDGQRSAFKTSTGAEVRFFMPVLNVPFRLIFAYNPQRGGVLDNTLRPQKAFQFRFAVGTTF
ncbi:MAG TPA: outer membrane protein assembly factor BamA [Vicinamibacterales bacterium]|nr:outer membrane protein assembly factor BamA [Vicinamibacterales bacterium]